VDSAGNVWGINSNAVITVNGVVDPITANVILLAYVNGVIWQEVDQHKIVGNIILIY
jgi:hypothetical protein